MVRLPRAIRISRVIVRQRLALRTVYDTVKLVEYQKAGQNKKVARREGPMNTAFVALVLLAGAGGSAVAEVQPTKSEITTKRKDDAVEVRVGKDRTVFSLKSPCGISQPVIERVDEKWSGAVVLRLHLKGLENFLASNGKVTLDAAVSIHDGNPKVRFWKDGKKDAPPDETAVLDGRSHPDQG
jgi:hypothetical protein